MSFTASRWFAGLMFGLIALACLPAHAQWKWRDAAGRVQYSDRPPPAGTPAKDILQSPIVAAPVKLVPASAPGASAPATAASAVDPALDAKRKQAEQQQEAQRKADEAKQAQARAENCERARTSMRTLESGQRLSRVNDKGEREVLDDSARARELEQGRRVIASECR